MPGDVTKRVEDPEGGTLLASTCNHASDTHLVLLSPGEACSAEASQGCNGCRAARRLVPELSPRERLLDVGPEALSSAELLAVLFGVGGDQRKALEVAGQVVSESGGLYGLRGASFHDLLGLHGVGEAKACVFLAAVELGKRLGSIRGPDRPVISSPADVDALLRGRIAHLDREHFVCLLLNTTNTLIGCPTISVGTLNSSLVHPREVFKPAIRASAASVVLAHNHPSGNVQPSHDDREVTKRLTDVAKIVGIEILDHVILGDGFYSMKEHGFL